MLKVDQLGQRLHLRHDLARRLGRHLHAVKLLEDVHHRLDLCGRHLQVAGPRVPARSPCCVTHRSIALVRHNTRKHRASHDLDVGWRVTGYTISVTQGKPRSRCEVARIVIGHVRGADVFVGEALAVVVVGDVDGEAAQHAAPQAPVVEPQHRRLVVAHTRRHLRTTAANQINYRRFAATVCFQAAVEGVPRADLGLGEGGSLT